jgi:formylmethanofuran dehydrogenase subunit C
MGTRVRLTLRVVPDLPVDAESLLPETVAGKDRAAIEALPLTVGNRDERAGDYFTVTLENEDSGEERTRADGEIVLTFTGDLRRFKRIGEGMGGGRVIVEGAVGFHAGAWMSGGRLTVRGDAGDFLGAHMSGGRIEVEGSAGHFAGSSYGGYDEGMTGGMILIGGDAGQMTGARMRRGLIAVKGACGDLTGYAMHAGTVLVGGPSQLRTGANMVRGTIMLFSPPAEMLPTFRFNCIYRPAFWPILRESLAREAFCLPRAEDGFAGYSGDINEGGRGEILLWRRCA